MSLPWNPWPPEPSTVAPPGGSTWVVDTLSVNFDGQTAFTLSTLPLVAANVQLYVNGVRYMYAIDFTIAALALTWLDLDFAMETSDTIQAFYQT